MATKNPEKIFVTGATGYIGSIITGFAVADGYAVRGLSRSEAGDAKLRELGAIPVRGGLTSHDVLRRESAEANIILHLASAYVFGQGSYDDALPIDNAAVDAIADVLAGTGKPFVTTLGTLAVAADPSGAETDENSPLEPNPINTRVKHEQHALAYAGKGVKVMSVRLAPFVYGRGGSGVKFFMDMSAQAGDVTIVDGGKNRTTVVHVDDAARLYLLAAQKGKAGEIYNASGGTDVTFRQMFGAMATALDLPLRKISYEDAKSQLGDTVAWLFSAENRASGAKAQKLLGWKPTGVGCLEDINQGSYQAIAEGLRK